MVKINKTHSWADGTYIDAHEGWGIGTRNRKLLESDCSEKCYICEHKPKNVNNLTVDHIVSIDSDPRLEYVWENLLLACRRCNHDVKGNKYNSIINPCETDPEEKINFGISYDMRDVSISPRSNDKGILETKQLLDEVYSDRMLTRKLAAELNRFYKYVPNAILGDEWAIEYIHESIHRFSIFAAFKRKIVRDYPELSIIFGNTLA